MWRSVQTSTSFSPGQHRNLGWAWALEFVMGRGGGGRALGIEDDADAKAASSVAAIRSYCEKRQVATMDEPPVLVHMVRASARSPRALLQQRDRNIARQRAAAVAYKRLA